MAAAGFIFLTLSPQVHEQAIIKDEAAMPGMSATEIAAAQSEAFRRASSSSATSSGSSTDSGSAAPLKRFLKLSPGSKMGDWTTVAEDESAV